MKGGGRMWKCKEKEGREGKKTRREGREGGGGWSESGITNTHISCACALGCL